MVMFLALRTSFHLSSFLYQFGHKNESHLGVTPLDGVTRAGLPPTTPPPLVTPLGGNLYGDVDGEKWCPYARK